MFRERNVHESRKTAAAHEKPTASVLGQRLRHPGRRDSMNSTHEGVYERATRPAWHQQSEHRQSGTPRLVRLGWSVAGLSALALVAAACTGGGSSYSGAGSYGAAPATSSGPPSAAVVDLRGSELGQTLVDGQGRTLYLFEADKAGKSNCDGACTSAWPPYVGNGVPQAGTGVTGALLGTSIRGDGGGAQLIYGGHPLYYYAGDNRPGDAAGQGLNQFGAKWYVVAANGDKIDTD
jgi:predicted lipoprotein with Yx(FWY)xxD motif